MSGLYANCHDFRLLGYNLALRLKAACKAGYKVSIMQLLVTVDIEARLVELN